MIERKAEDEIVMAFIKLGDEPPGVGLIDADTPVVERQQDELIVRVERRRRRVFGFQNGHPLCGVGIVDGRGSPTHDHEQR